MKNQQSQDLYSALKEMAEPLEKIWLKGFWTGVWVGMVLVALAFGAGLFFAHIN